MEAAQRYLEAKDRRQVGSEGWARATASAFNMLIQEECAEAAKPEWWNDEGLKALSARLVKAAPNDDAANFMRARVLRGRVGAWKAGPRSAVELNEAAAHFDRSAALSSALGHPAAKLQRATLADWCRSEAEGKPGYVYFRNQGKPGYFRN